MSNDLFLPQADGAEVPEGTDGPAEHVGTGVAVPGLLTLDVSWSMHSALAAAHQALVAFIDQIRRTPLVASQAQMGIVTFADTAAEDLGFSPIADPATTVPALNARGNGTNLHAALTQTLTTLRAGVPALATNADGAKRVVMRPSVFVVTDGQPNTGGDWSTVLTEIRALPFRPNIFAFGFGQADRDVIRRIADEGCAYFAEDGQTPTAVFDQILAVILRTMITVTNGNAAGAAAAAPVDPQADPATKGLIALGPVNV